VSSSPSTSPAPPADLPAVRAIADHAGSVVIERRSAFAWRDVHGRRFDVHRRQAALTRTWRSCPFTPVKHLTTGGGGSDHDERRPARRPRCATCERTASQRTPGGCRATTALGITSNKRSASTIESRIFSALSASARRGSSRCSSSVAVSLRAKYDEAFAKMSGARPTARRAGRYAQARITSTSCGVRTAGPSGALHAPARA